MKERFVYRAHDLDGWKIEKIFRRHIDDYVVMMNHEIVDPEDYDKTINEVCKKYFLFDFNEALEKDVGFMYVYDPLYHEVNLLLHI